MEHKRFCRKLKTSVLLTLLGTSGFQGQAYFTVEPLYILLSKYYTKQNCIILFCLNLHKVHPFRPCAITDNFTQMHSICIQVVYVLQYSTQYNNTPAGLIRIVFTSVYIWVLYYVEYLKQSSTQENQKCMLDKLDNYNQPANSTYLALLDLRAFQLSNNRIHICIVIVVQQNTWLHQYYTSVASK